MPPSPMRGRNDMICNLVRLALLLLLAAAPAAHAQDAAAKAQAAAKAMVEAGGELFKHAFEVGTPFIPGGDGLGPMYNAVSCAACHQQAATGGAGPIDANAAMLSVEQTKF